MTAQRAPESPRERAGAQCLLTPAAHRGVVEALATGCSKQDAAEVAGVGRSTLYGWLRTGRRDLEAGSDTPHARLATDIEAAMARARHSLLKKIQEAAQKPGQWQAAAWILERRYPEDFGRERAEIVAMRREMKEMRAIIDELRAGKKG